MKKWVQILSPFFFMHTREIEINYNFECLYVLVVIEW